MASLSVIWLDCPFKHLKTTSFDPSNAHLYHFYHLKNHVGQDFKKIFLLSHESLNVAGPRFEPWDLSSSRPISWQLSYASPPLSKAILLLSHASVQLSYALPHLQSTPHPNLATSHPNLDTPHFNLATPSHQEVSGLNLFITWKHKLPISPEYNRVCPLVGIGPPPLSP
jgi:hypothetical protein